MVRTHVTVVEMKVFEGLTAMRSRANLAAPAEPLQLVEVRAALAAGLPRDTIIAWLAF
jgi:hypothetical protein